ncbi:MAG: OmpA family protein [Methylococcaceae bacterium]|nr:OmpA family protein [Methylococcaceae bacterium]
MKRQLCAMGFTALIAWGAQAGDFQDDRFYLAPYGSFIHTGGERGSQDGWGGGLAVGKIINEFFNVEIEGFWQGFDGKAPFRGRSDLIGGTVDMLYFFSRDTFSPYIVTGIGAMNTSARIPGARIADDASFIFETGVGATYEIADNFLLRGDVRYRLDTLPSSLDIPKKDVFHDMVINIGFVIPFSDKPRAATRIEPTAPAPQTGCSTRDSDQDGVNDCDDKCPGTVKGAKIDSYGCPIRIELKGVNFHFDSAELTEQAKAILDKVAGELMAFPVKRDIEVQGHTSSEGSNAYNMGLSQRRSQSVVNYLKRKGLSNKLYAKGYGEDYPIADNSTEAGRSRNRRVELVWMGE